MEAAFPIKGGRSAKVMKAGPGSFWEDRSDRFHCGVDIYAPKGSEVVSAENGTVLDSGLMTSKEMIPYWNTTYYLLIKNESSGLIAKYGELKDVLVGKGDCVKAGQLIGHVGAVLNPDRIDENSPAYIRKLKRRGNLAMLHFEMYEKNPISRNGNYLGGNWFDRKIKPAGLIDPTEYLKSLIH